jgi:hypothetical protein
MTLSTVRPHRRVLVAILSAAIATVLAACQPTDPAATPAAAAPAPAPAAPASEPAPPVDVAGVFASAPLDIEREAITTCNIEAVDSRHFAGEPIEVSSGGSFLLGGYLYDATSESVPDNLRLRLVGTAEQGAWETAIDGRLDRPDVVNVFKLAPWALRSGFAQDVQVGTLPTGRYHLMVSFERDGKRFVCDNGRNIEVVSGASAPAA